jgi:hypothetical protein
VYLQAVGDEIKNFVLKCLNVIFASIRDRKKVLQRFFNDFYLIIFSSFIHSTTCGSNGIFSRRLDFTLYNVIPKQRINSIEVKVGIKIHF